MGSYINVPDKGLPVGRHPIVVEGDLQGQGALDSSSLPKPPGYLLYRVLEPPRV